MTLLDFGLVFFGVLIFFFGFPVLCARIVFWFRDFQMPNRIIRYIYKKRL